MRQLCGLLVALAPVGQKDGLGLGSRHLSVLKRLLFDSLLTDELKHVHGSTPRPNPRCLVGLCAALVGSTCPHITEQIWPVILTKRLICIESLHTFQDDSPPKARLETSYKTSLTV